jgi:hypothetical protein
MNFPLVQYLDMTDQEPLITPSFRTGVKWVNIYGDFRAFLKYRRTKGLSLIQWTRSLRGEKVLSDFAWDDVLPCILGIGMKLSHRLKFFPSET